jgi:hypothetical protein
MILRIFPAPAAAAINRRMSLFRTFAIYQEVKDARRSRASGREASNPTRGFSNTTFIQKLLLIFASAIAVSLIAFNIFILCGNGHFIWEINIMKDYYGDRLKLDRVFIGFYLI